MKWKNMMVSMAAMLMVMAMPAAAQELPDPGITPDSPFYFLDRAFSVFQPAESLANERAAEVIAMADKAHQEGLQTAMQQYEKAMVRRLGQSERSSEEAEEVARQTSNHLVAFAQVRDRVPEQALPAIDTAIAGNLQGRELALNTLARQQPERAMMVAQETLQEVMARTPEQAQQGLQQAMQAIAERQPGIPAGIPADIQPGVQPDQQRREGPQELPAQAPQIEQGQQQVPEIEQGQAPNIGGPSVEVPSGRSPR